MAAAAPALVVADLLLHSSSSRTESRIVSAVHNWEIHDFATTMWLKKTEQAYMLSSPRFCVRLPPPAEEEEDGKVVSAFFRLGVDMHSDTPMVVLNADGEDAVVMEPRFYMSIAHFPTVRPKVTGRPFGGGKESRRTGLFLDAALTDELKQYDGTLTVICEFKVARLKPGAMDAETRFAAPEPRHRSGGEALWEAVLKGREGGGLHSDVVLTCGDGGEMYHSHRGILAASSTVFAAMFANKDCKESQSGMVMVEDMSAAALRAFLCFIYTGRIKDRACAEAENGQEADTLLQVLAASEKYEISDLKLKCEEEISHGLNVDNACRVASAAELHRAGNLRTCAVAYVVEHFKEIVCTEEWKTVPRKVVDDVNMTLAQKLNM